MTDWLVDHPRAIIATIIVLVIGSIALCVFPGLRIEAGIEPFFDRSSQMQKDLDLVEEHFVNDDLLYVAYRPADAFSHDSLEAVRRIGKQLDDMMIPGKDGPVHGIADVLSLTTVKDLIGSEMNFRTELLVPPETPTDAAALAHIKERALYNTLIREALISKDGGTASLTARLTPSLDEEQQAIVVEKTREILAKAETEQGGTKYYVTGDAVLRSDMAVYMVQDLAKLLPINYLVIIVLLYVFLRRAWGVVLVCINVTLTLIVGTGMLVLIGGTLNNLTAMLPPVVMILSTSIIIYFLFELGKHTTGTMGGETPRDTFRVLIVPAFMCMCTTMVGFGSLAVSSVPAMVQFGLGTGLALVMSFLISCGVIALVTRWFKWDTFINPRGLALSSPADHLVAGYTNFSIRNPKKMLTLAALIFVGAVAGVPRMVVDTNLVQYFHSTTPLRAAEMFIADNIGGTSLIVVSIKHTAKDHFVEPANLAKLEKLEAFLEKESGDTLVTSVTSYVHIMHRAFFNEDKAFDRIPDTGDQVSQLLLLNQDSHLSEYIDSDHSWVRVSARTREHGSGKLGPTYDHIAAYLAENFPAKDGYTTYATGQARLAASTLDSVVESQTNSLTLSFILIFGPIFLIFRSIKAGLITMPSNLFPIGVTLGLMAWTGIKLDIATAMVCSVSLGIAVDDTIHFVQYMRYRLGVHGNVEQALRESLEIKGMGALWTALVMGLGFGVCMVSNFAPTQYFGLFTALAMMCGVIGEVLILPSIILVTGTRLGVKPLSAEALAAYAAAHPAVHPASASREHAPGAKPPA